MTWSRSVAVAAGTRDGKALELLVADRLGFTKDESSGLLSSYLQGTRKSFAKWAPKPYSIWVERTSRLWPETGPWFYAPVWYLMEEQEYLPGQIQQCIELLPRNFQELLLTEPHNSIPGPMRLRVLWGDLVYELTRPMSPWALGAMACALRRAELAGSIPVYLRASMGLIWVLDRLIAEQDPWVQEPLLELRRMLLLRMNRTVYDVNSFFTLEISEKTLAFFSSGLKKYEAKRNASI